jgi:Zn-dependent protease with chaperone function
MSRDDLASYYAAECERSASNALDVERRISRLNRLLWMIPLGLALLSLLARARLDDLDRRHNSHVASLYGGEPVDISERSALALAVETTRLTMIGSAIWLICSLTSLALLASSLKPGQRLANLIQDNKLVLANNDSRFAVLVESVNELCWSMSWKGSVSIWILKARETSPVALVINDHAHLVFPAALLRDFSGSSRDRVRAMIAHELGHFVQRDSKLFLRSEGIAHGILWCVLPSLLLALLVSAVFAHSPISMSIILVVGDHARRLRSELRNFRKNAEELADIAALLHVGREATEAALRQLLLSPNDHDDQDHPGARYRLDQIVGFAQKFGIDPPRPSFADAMGETNR